MPNGHVHQAAARAVTVGASLAGIGLAILHPPALGIVFGGWLGQYVDPDLDHQAITQSERRILKHNQLLGIAWVLYWRPYQRSHPHRGVAHTWPIGTLERFMLALWPLLLLSAGLVWATDGDALPVVVWWWIYVFIGQSIQDIVHITMDRVSTGIKRHQRRWVRR